IGVLVYKLNPFLVVIFSILPDVLLALFLLLFLKPLIAWSSQQSKALALIFNWSTQKAGLKTKKYIEKYGFVGLALFVGIPLPSTGVWTACLASCILGISFKKSFLAISSGCLIAGLVVLGVTLSGISLERYFGFKAMLGLIALIVFGIIVKRFIFKRKIKPL
ncbi:small multi-drug export protein, partial [Candidatus Gribaldobacteria bacterium]|nr:small multi-drug export protein [Candidatus Gribaldobacteria bacterium]